MSLVIKKSDDNIWTWFYFQLPLLCVWYFRPKVFRVQKKLQNSMYCSQNKYKKGVWFWQFNVNESLVLITCYEHWCESMYFDTCVCWLYNRATFFRTIIENEPCPIRKCYSCYRGSVKKLLKHFWSTGFIISNQNENWFCQI